MAGDAESFVERLAIILGDRERKRPAARLLKAVLHSVRDLMPLDASLHLMAQLPMFLKAIYVEGWGTHERKRMKHAGDLREHMIRKERLNEDELPDAVAAEHAVEAVFTALRLYLSPGEIEKIAAHLPKDLKKLVTTRYSVL
jgi:uncharacterized protein (DUF2267 family)